MIRKACLLSLLVILNIVRAEAQPPKLIIRGDDMGFSHSGNLALIKSCKKGIVQSIELLVPSPWFPEAVKLLKENSGIDVGIHLSLSSEWENIKWRPLTDCPSLKDVNGYFYPMIFPNKNYLGQSLSENKWVLAEIEKEFRAQIETGIRNVPRISHLSAHMGCTGLSPDVQELTKKLATEYGLRYDLQPYAVNSVGYDGPHTTYAEKENSFLKMLDKLEPGKTYLFLDHPGLDNEELRAIYHIGYENVATDRQGVTDLFASEKIRKAITEKGIQLLSYKMLGEN
jgi:predicted glycoside hydrolase/deacetylase ChbG (UPF0249 family)